MLQRISRKRDSILSDILKLTGTSAPPRHNPPSRPEKHQQEKTFELFFFVFVYLEVPFRQDYKDVEDTARSLHDILDDS